MHENIAANSYKLIIIVEDNTVKETFVVFGDDGEKAIDESQKTPLMLGQSSTHEPTLHLDQEKGNLAL
ncbi:hypothetical protein SCA6_014126 [Theobroma cacao]